jgi:hypothetical protein
LVSGEQFSPGLGELNICSALVQLQPPALDRQFTRSDGTARLEIVRPLIFFAKQSEKVVE